MKTFKRKLSWNNFEEPAANSCRVHAQKQDDTDSPTERQETVKIKITLKNLAFQYRNSHRHQA